MYLSTLNKYKGASSNDFSKVWDALSNKVNEVIDEVTLLVCNNSNYIYNSLGSIIVEYKKSFVSFATVTVQ